jgi:two-component system cell cycle response regulator
MLGENDPHAAWDRGLSPWRRHAVGLGLTVTGCLLLLLRPLASGLGAAGMLLLGGCVIMLFRQLAALQRESRALRQEVRTLSNTLSTAQDELQVMQDFTVTLAEFDEETVRLKAEIEAQNHALADANALLALLASTDPLTGLANHGALAEALERETTRARENDRGFAILFLDLDHFKALNDSCGHQAGDAMLVELAALARQVLSPASLIGRWGGEEFLAILPEASSPEALAVAERLRATVANHPFAASGGGALTCSIGLAMFPRDAQEGGRLVAAADSAMYAAKRLGRNQVRAVSDPAVAALDGVTGRTDAREDAALIGTVEALATLVETRDQYTGQHCRAVQKLAAAAARALGMEEPEVRLVEMAARLQDVGKIAIPDALLQKDDGPLTEEDWGLLRRHPIIGADVVSRVPALRVLAPMIRSHHERWDGTGYPDGLAGENIPFGARIVAVADTYRALTFDRPYHKARSADKALAELRRCGGTQFDARVVEALAAAAVPPITLAESASDQFGCVTLPVRGA